MRRKIIKLNNKGFNLIEISVFLIIIISFAMMVLPKIQDKREFARKSEALTNLNAISQAMDLYFIVNDESRAGCINATFFDTVPFSNPNFDEIYNDPNVLDHFTYTVDCESGNWLARARRNLVRNANPGETNTIRIEQPNVGDAWRLCNEAGSYYTDLPAC